MVGCGWLVGMVSCFKVKVCDEEMHHPRAMPSLVLLNFLEARHPNYEFKFVIGTDLIEQLRSWDAQGCPGAWDEIPDAGDIIFETKEFLGEMPRLPTIPPSTTIPHPPPPPLPTTNAHHQCLPPTAATILATSSSHTSAWLRTLGRIAVEL